MTEEEQLVSDLICKARKAQASYESQGSQALYRLAAKAAAWALMDPERNLAFSQMAVSDTGLGNVADKVTKNHRKTLGLLRDLEQASSHGVISDNQTTGITEIARPKGVIGAVVPSTNPVATPTNNVVNAVFCGNAIILAPSPRGQNVCEALIQAIHAEFDKIGIPKDLVQMLPKPASKGKTQALMTQSDCLIVTGSQDNVRRAYTSGTPAFAVGAGNVPVIIDETADLKEAASKIVASKSFDNATSCSSENNLIVVNAVWDDFIEAMADAGGHYLPEAQGNLIKHSLYTEHGLNRHLIAKDLPDFLEQIDGDISVPNHSKILLIQGDGIGPDFPESGEKLSLVTTIYRVADFEAAIMATRQVLDYVGAGHSVGLHSQMPERAEQIAMTLPASRVICNQAHCFATGGAFDNGMPFSLSMGCGTWGGNVTDENLHYKHYLNTTKIVRVIPAVEPSVEAVLGPYWEKAGK